MCRRKNSALTFAPLTACPQNAPRPTRFAGRSIGARTIRHPSHRRCTLYVPKPARLLPIKDLRNAKKRLTGVLSPEERFGLAQAMLSDAIRAIQGLRQAETIF